MRLRIPSARCLGRSFNPLQSLESGRISAVARAEPDPAAEPSSRASKVSAFGLCWLSLGNVRKLAYCHSHLSDQEAALPRRARCPSAPTHLRLGMVELQLWRGGARRALLCMPTSLSRYPQLQTQRIRDVEDGLRLSFPPRGALQRPKLLRSGKRTAPQQPPASPRQRGCSP